MMHKLSKQFNIFLINCLSVSNICSHGTEKAERAKKYTTHTKEQHKTTTKKVENQI
jgi:hypothetical protein